MLFFRQQGGKYMPPDITEIMKKYKCCLLRALLIFNSIKEDNTDELCTNKQSVLQSTDFPKQNIINIVNNGVAATYSLLNMIVTKHC